MAIVSFSRQWDVDIKIGPNSRRNNKSQSEYELRIKTDSTRRKSSWNQPDWGRWKSIFHQLRVHVFGYMGAVRFIGYLSDPNGGEWKGIELDHPHPRGNDGFFDGVRYFTCEQRHCIFARPSAVFHEYFFRNDRFYSNEHSTLLLFKCKLLWYRVN